VFKVKHFRFHAPQLADFTAFNVLTVRKTAVVALVFSSRKCTSCVSGGMKVEKVLSDELGKALQIRK